MEHPTWSREERVNFRWRRLLLLTYLVVPASTAQLCLMTRGEIRERKLRVAQETRERLRGRSRNQAKRRKEEQQETSTNFDISNSQRRIGTLETTTNRRLACESVGMSARDRVKSVSGECSPGMDDVSVMRSSLDSNDGTKRHTDEEGSGSDTAPFDASMSRLRKSDAVSTNIRQEGDVHRLKSISPLQ